MSILREEEARIRQSYGARSWDAYSWTSPAYQFMMQERERRILALLEAQGALPLAERSILEVGCGTGAWLRDFVKWGATPSNLVGIDLVDERVQQARRLCSPGTRVITGSGTDLAFPDASFDIVLQATVFTSILDSAIRSAVAREMLRVVRPGGFILWYDFHVNNPRNRDVRRVDGAELRTLFPNCRIDSERATLAPPIARAVAPRSWVLATLLGGIPALSTHTLAAMRPS